MKTLDEKQAKPEFLRLIFSSILGTTRSIELAYDRKEEVFEEGVFFDGSSVRGYADVNSSDLLLRPLQNNPLPAPWDPLMEIVPCSVHEVSGTPHMCDPVNVLKHVSDKAYEKGYMMVAGFELEFFLTGLEDSMLQPADRAGYFATTPADRGLQLRRDVIMSLSGMGITTTTHHHEVANGQHEIGLKHRPALDAATSLMLARHVIAELASRRGMTATFMAKPFVSMNGSGMHIHQSLWNDDLSSNLFATERASEVSDIAGHYVAGILKHAKALSAIVAPTVNSFKRLVPGFEAPTRIAWGPRNRTTMLRIPQFNGSAKSARIEFRCPDPSCSPHLALAAILSAGMDGVSNELAPPEPTEKDLFHGTTEVESLPVSLTDALDSLRSNSLLLDSLGSRVVDTYLDLKKAEWSRYLDSTGDPGPFEVTDWEISEYLQCN